MKIVKVWRTLCGILLCGLIFCSSLGAQQVKKTLLNVGSYYEENITEVDGRDVSAALAVWAKEIGDQYGFEVKTSLYISMEQLAEDFINKKIDFVTIPTLKYVMFASAFKVTPELANVRNNRITTRYLLVVNKSNRNNALTDLKNKRLAIRKNNALGRMFLDVELMKSKLPRSDRLFAAIQESTKENQAALAVFFGQADACIITDACFGTMVELNPQVGRQLKVMKTSPEFVEMVAFFNKDYPPQYKERSMEGLVNGVRESKRLNQFRLLFNTEGLKAITSEELDTVRTLFADYNRLNGENKKQHH
ncbi:MAG TPA: PhnD/SsuA/transferrin family substrate-binding protein [Thermodesulfobacteriota bacterium]|nr:PhnD/SsuA/transferrin family substrate-binding protein [Thermodesulfobacteriota bacterium]